MEVMIKAVRNVEARVLVVLLLGQKAMFAAQPVQEKRHPATTPLQVVPLLDVGARAEQVEVELTLLGVARVRYHRMSTAMFLVTT